MENCVSHLEPMDVTTTARNSHEASQPVGGSAASVVTPATAEPEKKRTLGMMITDGIIYPLVTNPAVWGLSVIATYLTQKGGDKHAAATAINETGKTIKAFFEEDGKEVLRKVAPGESLEGAKIPEFGMIGRGLASRGKWLDQKFKNLGASDEQAQGLRFVTFSFIDGSLLEPITSTLEKNRNDISQGIDGVLGTQPKDTAVYDEEPARGDGSLLAGRAITAGIVVPTALYLNKERGTNIDGTPKKSFNATLLDEPGIKLGENVQAMIEHGLENVKPTTLGERATLVAAKMSKGLDKLSGHTLDKKSLFQTIVFEAFYTTVCTAGLYASSWLLAGKQKDVKAESEKPHDAQAQQSIDQWAAKKVAQVTTPKEQPLTRISPQRDHHIAHDTQTVHMPAQQPVLQS